MYCTCRKNTVAHQNCLGKFSSKQQPGRNTTRTEYAQYVAIATQQQQREEIKVNKQQTPIGKSSV